MSKYDSTRFYWLQLKEDFFEDDAISWLEEQQPNGRDYAYFYLKLCLKALKSNGVLIRKVGNILIPYDNKKLAELTKIDYDTVVIAMELLKKIGLVQILQNGEIYINQLENLIGSQSLGAFKKQQQRLLENGGGGQMSANCPPKIELEKEIDNRVNIDDEDIYTYYENNIGQITPRQYEIISNYLSIFNSDIIKEAINRASDNNARSFKYVDGILKSWKEKGFTTLGDVLNEKKNKKAQVPEWLDKKIEREELDPEELKKLEKEMEMFN